MKIKHTPKPISYLINKKEKIDTNPSWQRGPVWAEGKKALLIDSILRDYDIPMIYLRVINPGGTFSFEVVDGQQRLRAIWDFVEGEFTLPSQYEKVGRAKIGGKGFSDLAPSLKKKLREFKIVIAFVKDVRQPDLSILFSRMQMGVRLNPPELRNAVQTGLRHGIDSIAAVNPFFLNSKISPSRFKHQDYLAHAFSVCFHSGRNDLKAPNLMHDYISITSGTEFQPVLNDANKILDFLSVINNKTMGRIRQKWIFVDLFYLLYTHRQNLGKIDKSGFAATYVKFDSRRLEYNSEPELLLKDPKVQANVDLYDYIQAFNAAGAVRKNVDIRHNILKRAFTGIV